MRHQLLPASALIVALALVSGPSAAKNAEGAREADHRAFVGLWQAIDSLDGSTQLLSITCARGEGCDVRLNDTLFTLSCPNQIGFAQGDGTIRRGVLTVELTLTCGDTTLSQLNEFVFDRSNGTLTNLNDDPGLPNVFHRISR
jgi:hypothetical protein